MAGKHRSDGRGVGGGEAAEHAAYNWFASADSAVATCDRWDVKADLFAAAVLQLLAKGRGLTIALTWDQTAIKVTVLDGDLRAPIRVNDSIEFDDVMTAVLRRASTLEKAPIREWKDVKK